VKRFAAIRSYFRRVLRIFTNPPPPKRNKSNEMSRRRRQIERGIIASDGIASKDETHFILRQTGELTIKSQSPTSMAKRKDFQCTTSL